MIEDIVHRATLNAAPPLVWQAIATPAGLSAWMMQNDFAEAKVGHRFRFTDKPRPFWDGICDCEVVQADADQCFSLLWGLNQKGAPSRVTWTLRPSPDGGTEVEFRHGGLHGVTGWLMKKGMSKGWQRMLERSIPLVADSIGKGEIPSREAVLRAYRGG